MKEEFNSTIDVEQLLRVKSWEQLNTEEREAATEAFGTAAEYEHVRMLMFDLRSEAGIVEEELKPSAQVHANLMAAFDEEQRRRRVLWWNSLGFWLRDQLRFDIPAVRIAVAGVIVTVGIIAVMQLAGNETPQTPVADNGKVQPLPAEDTTPKLEDNREPDGMNILPWTNEEFVQVPVYVPQIIAPVVDSALPEPVHTVVSPNNDLLVNNDSVQNGMLAVTDSVNPGMILLSNGSFACCGANEMLTNATGAASYSYDWTSNTNVSFSPTNSNVGVYTITPPNCRSLANDSKVINAMFSMK